MLEKKNTNLEEWSLFSYEKQEDKLMAYYRMGRKKIQEEVIYSKHNCEVLNHRIEREILEQQKSLLQLKEKGKKMRGTMILSIVFLQFLCGGNVEMGLLLLTFTLPTMFSTFMQIQQLLTMNEQRLFCIEALKEEKIELTEEEIKFLSPTEKIVYEKSGELTIGNMNEVCNPKILKKRFGKKNG